MDVAITPATLVVTDYAQADQFLKFQTTVDRVVEAVGLGGRGRRMVGLSGDGRPGGAFLLCLDRLSRQRTQAISRNASNRILLVRPHLNRCLHFPSDCHHACSGIRTTRAFG